MEEEQLAKGHNGPSLLELDPDLPPMPMLFPVFLPEDQGVDPKPSVETEKDLRRLCWAVIKSTKEGRRRQGLQKPTTWDETLPLTSWVTLSKALILSVPWFPDL